MMSVGRILALIYLFVVISFMAVVAIKIRNDKKHIMISSYLGFAFLASSLIFHHAVPGGGDSLVIIGLSIISGCLFIGAALVYIGDRMREG